MTKYLRIKVDGVDGYLKAAENTAEEKKDSAPDYKGPGISVWLNESSKSADEIVGVAEGSNGPKVEMQRTF